MSGSGYLPLSQYPHQSTPSKAAGFAATYLYRRRTLLTVVLVTSVFTLVVGFEYFFKDVSDFDGDSQVYYHSSEAPHNLYLPFQLDYEQSQSSPSTLLRPVQDLPYSCLDRHYTTGDLCHNPDIKPFDVVWTWVNGSDPLLSQAKNAAQQSYAPNDPYRPQPTVNQDRQFRCAYPCSCCSLRAPLSHDHRVYVSSDHDELRHSMRSVIANYRPYADHFYLLTSDFDVPENFPEYNFTTEAMRLGQMPQWLDPSRRQQASNDWHDGNIALTLVPHARIFRPWQGPVFNRCEDILYTYIVSSKPVSGPQLWYRVSASKHSQPRGERCLSQRRLLHDCAPHTHQLLHFPVRSRLSHAFRSRCTTGHA